MFNIHQEGQIYIKNRKKVEQSIECLWQ